MKILITGGSGFIGRNLKRLLTGFGYEVFAPTHQELDLTNIMSVFPCIRTVAPDVIIHTALTGDNRTMTYDQFKENIRMFNNIKDAVHETNTLVLNMGSGAEFDRQCPINDTKEEMLWKRWPIDLYGLAKNIIARRTLEELTNGCVFRLFGCFGEDEQEHRFIKKSILRLKHGLPIQIDAVTTFDFFYINDVASAIDHFLKFGGNDHMNLVYPEKADILQISAIIRKEMNVFIPNEFPESESAYAPTYTGDGLLLKQSGTPLLGLEGGLRRMVKNLK